MASSEKAGADRRLDVRPRAWAMGVGAAGVVAALVLGLGSVAGIACAAVGAVFVAYFFLGYALDSARGSEGDDGPSGGWDTTGPYTP